MTTAAERREAATLSEGQADVLQAFRRMAKEKGYPPTIRELQIELAYASTNSIREILNNLEAKGYVQRDRLVARGVTLTEKGLAA